MDDVVMQLAQELQVALRTAAQIGETLFRIQAERHQRQAQASRQQADALNRVMRAEQRLAEPIYTQLNKPKFWDTANVSEIARAYGLAARFAPIDPNAAIIYYQTQARFKDKYGISIDQVATSQQQVDSLDVDAVPVVGAENPILAKTQTNTSLNQAAQAKDTPRKKGKYAYTLPEGQTAIQACIPEVMQPKIDAGKAQELEDMLQERLDAGWKPSEIKMRLDKRLPDDVYNMAGLLKTRIRDIDPAQAPAALQAEKAAAALQREKEAAIQLEQYNQAIREQELAAMSPMERAQHDAWEAVYQFEDATRSQQDSRARLHTRVKHKLDQELDNLKNTQPDLSDIQAHEELARKYKKRLEEYKKLAEEETTLDALTSQWDTREARAQWVKEQFKNGTPAPAIRAALTADTARTLPPTTATQGQTAPRTQTRKTTAARTTSHRLHA